MAYAQSTTLDPNFLSFRKAHDITYPANNSSMVRFSSLLILLMVGLGSCQAIECRSNPGCPPPGTYRQTLYFRLVAADGELIELPETQQDSIYYTCEGEQDFALPESENNTYSLRVSQLLERHGSADPISCLFRAPIGDEQILYFVIDRKPADACGWCYRYFFSEVRQTDINGITERILYAGQYRQEVVDIVIP
ncbi:MAG TPA: hypothetical protein DCR93_17920 [Cytophagales bacterium]|nr:hypothetical protein [Cytophagales bacterium]